MPVALPSKVNAGRWLTAYTLYELRSAAPEEFVLPVCPLGAALDACAEQGQWVLPPLFREALDDELRGRMVRRIGQCFPTYDPSGASNQGRLQVAECSPVTPAPSRPPKVYAFSVDTAVEEHGPHLPLATDTIQSYGVLQQLEQELQTDGLMLGPPADYGQLTWGLPFGYSIDLTAELLTRYVARLTDAVLDRWRPESVYVVDVHGSIMHREAIVEGLRQSRARRWAFRWLHEPLIEFASQRGDQHAGGVETALVEHISADLVDRRWWPGRIDDIACGQMSFAEAVELTPDLPRFVEHVRKHSLNGIVGDIHNYRQLDAQLMFDRMLDIARQDVAQLLAGHAPAEDAGRSAW